MPESHSANATAIETTDYAALLNEALADVAASEPDDALEPTFIDEQVEQSMTAWYLVYSTS